MLGQLLSKLHDVTCNCSTFFAGKEEKKQLIRGQNSGHGALPLFHGLLYGLARHKVFRHSCPTWHADSVILLPGSYMDDIEISSSWELATVATSSFSSFLVVQKVIWYALFIRIPEWSS